MNILNLFKKKIPCNSLEEYKEKNGFSNKELADEIEVSESYLSLVLTKKRTFGKKIALRVSRITGIPIENLIQ